ncbi:hypothetical protein C8R43DRAFT_1150706 [Mycena crocata]|nr:hypothetical protein C8R43DRAFT_1150706 [Mycena crocata]
MHTAHPKYTTSARGEPSTSNTGVMRETTCNLRDLHRLESRGKRQAVVDRRRLCSDEISGEATASRDRDCAFRVQVGPAAHNWPQASSLSVRGWLAANVRDAHAIGVMSVSRITRIRYLAEFVIGIRLVSVLILLKLARNPTNQAKILSGQVFHTLPSTPKNSPYTPKKSLQNSPSAPRKLSYSPAVCFSYIAIGSKVLIARVEYFNLVSSQELTVTSSWPAWIHENIKEAFAGIFSPIAAADPNNYCCVYNKDIKVDSEPSRLSNLVPDFRFARRRGLDEEWQSLVIFERAVLQMTQPTIRRVEQ